MTTDGQGGSHVDRAEARPAVDLAELRTEDRVAWEGKHFCPLCQCTKSGWADVPNLNSDWCDDMHCACHEDA